MDIMNLYTFSCWGYLHPGDFGGWVHGQEIKKGISFCSYYPKDGLAFLSPCGALLLENAEKITTSKVINQAYFSAKEPEDFPTRHICRKHCKKILRTLTKEYADVKNLLVLVTFEDELFLTFEDVLTRLRVKEDSIVNYEANQIVTGNGRSEDYYVRYVIFQMPNKHRTGIISNGKYLYNDNGVLKVLN